MFSRFSLLCIVCFDPPIGGGNCKISIARIPSHPQQSWVNSRSRFQIKFFFFGDLETLERIKLLEHRLSVSYLRQDYLEAQQTEQDDAVDSYQAASWERCTSTLQLEIQWLTDQIAKEQGAIA